METYNKNTYEYVKEYIERYGDIEDILTKLLDNVYK